MIPYSLNLISSFTPWRTYSSTEFYGNELKKRFEKLPHVTLKTQCFNDEEYEPADFALIHAYFSTNVYANMEKLKAKVRKVASFMEEPTPLADYNWYYSDADCKFDYQGHMIFPPVVRSMLSNTRKEPNTILLDHDIVEFWYYRRADLDWNPRIWKVMEQFKDTHKIYQLARHPLDQTPDFITKIPHCDPEEYLRLTGGMETYVITHHGSYNHTAVEMMCRGIRTLVPVMDGIPFVPLTNVRMFQMPTFADEGELADRIRQPVDRAFWDKQIDKCIDMDGMVGLMDHTFQKWISSLWHKERGFALSANLSWL